MDHNEPLKPGEYIENMVQLEQDGSQLTNWNVGSFQFH